MDILPMMIGVISVAFLLLYIAFKLDEQHYALKFLAFGFALIVLMFIPKVVIDSNYNCQFVLNDTEEVFKYGNNFTGYHWDYVGTDPAFNPADLNDPATVFLFHKYTEYKYTEICGDTKTTPISLQRVIVGFFTVYLLYILIMSFIWVYKGHKR